MTDENDEINKLSQKIIKSLESSTTDGIGFYVSILLESNKAIVSFDDYIDNLKQKSKVHTCQTSWDSDQLIIQCHNCKKNNTSCVCVNCFLKGNHQDHKIKIYHGSCGCCDCGDPMSWSKSGFCTMHSSPESNPELTQLDQDTRIKLISISKSAFYYCHKFASKNKDFFNNIIDFLTCIASIGDATRRCVCLAFCNSFDVINLYKNHQNFRSLEYSKLHSFFSLISNDDVFRTYFTTTILHDFPKIIKICQQLSQHHTQISKQPLLAMSHLHNLIFYASTQSVVTQLISESKIDWFKILNESLHLLIKLDSTQMVRSYLKNSFYSSSFSKVNKLFKSTFSALGNKNSKLIELIEKFSEILLESEFTYPITRILDEKISDPTETQLAVFDINFMTHYLIFKITKYEIFTEKPLFLLKNFFDSSTFKSIDIKINDVPVYFQSVLAKNIQISQFFSLHLLALNSLNLKGQKTLIDYISEVTDDVETFIKRWSIIPIRFLSASILNDFNFFDYNSYSTIVSFASFKFNMNVKYTFTPTFKLIQKLFKTTKDIDSFYLMVISIFDLTVIENKDNFKDDKKRVILLSIFHFISCLIFDTFCEQNDLYMMFRFKVISELMIKNMSLEDINSIWYKDVMYYDRFLNDLPNFTSKEITKNGTIYHLTDSSDWHPILPYLNLTYLIPLIQKFISKNPDSLINFPKIQSGFEYLLFSPTLWALMYCILDHESCKDYQIIHQLVFNVLIEISRNSEEFYKDKKFNQTENEHSILIVEKFDEFVQKLKNLTFEQFLKMKIIFNCYHKDEGKSMIDLLSGFGNIGFTVLKKMNISDAELNLSDSSLLLDEQIKKKNKERANQIKKQMMNSFNQKQKSFQFSALQIEETTEKVQKIECGICHIENKSDILVYPALIYKSSLSSYIKWRFRNAKLVNSNDDKNEFKFEDIPSSFKSFNTVQICLHPIHSHCIKNEDYFCPTDRCNRNSSLPIIDSIYDFDLISNQKLLVQINRFIKRAYNNDIKFAVFSLASEIEVLEMRYRSNPNCLDNQTTASKLRNIYLCIWHSLHENANKILIEEEYKRRRRVIFKKVENDFKNTDSNDTWSQYKKHSKSSNLPNLNKKISIESNVENICQAFQIPSTNKQQQNEDDIHLSPLMKYILYSMEIERNSNSHFLNMKKFIEGKFLPSIIERNDSELNHSEDDSIFKDKDIIDELSSDYQRLQFLRCSTIFDHFSRKQKIESNPSPNKDLIDWDEILSSSFLYRHYDIQNKGNDENEKELPMLSLFNVPENFLNFILPPFSLPVDNYDNGKIAICLLTGKVVSLSNDENHKTIKDFINDEFNGSFSIFLTLNGSNVSEVFVSNNELSCNFSLKSFYVNKFNDVDIGINNGFLLFLNQTKREEIIDNFLSGNWTSMFNHNGLN